MVLRKLAYRAARTQRLRTLLTLASIVIGVGCVVAIDLATTTARRSYAAMTEAVAGRVALEVTTAGEGAIPEALARQVADVPGVWSVTATIQRATVMYLADERVRLFAQGVDLSSELPRGRALGDYDLVAGSFPTGPGDVLLDVDFARRFNLQPDGRLRLLTRRGLVEVRVAGLLRPKAGGAIQHGVSLFMPLAAAQGRFRAQGFVDQLQLELEPDVDEAEVMAAISPLLPPGVRVHRPAARGAFAEETLLSFESGLRMATAFSLLAAVFIITNTFLMNVGQRRSQLAILRAIGATRRQILGLIYYEALLLALLGTALGLVCGWGGAVVLTWAMESLLHAQLPPIEPAIAPFLLAAAFGIGISLIGAWLPAFRATRVTPQEGIGQAAQQEGEAMPLWSIVLGSAVTFITAGLLGANLLGHLPNLDTVLTAVILLIALVPQISLLLRPLSAVGNQLIGLWVRIEARLARRQLLRHRTRTTLTIGVLFIASSTGFGLASALIDNVQDIRNWYRTAIVSDFFVRATMPDLETYSAATIPDNVGQQLREIPGITGIDTARFLRGEAAGIPVMMMAREFPDVTFVSFANLPVPPAEMWQRLRQGEVAIGTVLAQRTGLQAGDTIATKTAEGEVPLKIGAVVEEYQAGGLMIHLHRATAERLLGVEGVDVYLIKAEHDRLADIETALRRIAEPQGLIVQSFAELVTIIDAMMAGVVLSLWVLLTLGLIVAALGVTNTLYMNVLEQTRELAMLRVVAMTQRQVHRMVIAQSLLLGLIGILPGILTGIGLAYLINLATLQATGHIVQFNIHPTLAIGGFVVAMILVVGAAWTPAVRAARGDASLALRQG